MLNKSSIFRILLFFILLITPVYAQWTGVFNPGLLKSGTVTTNFPVVQTTTTTNSSGVNPINHNLPSGIQIGDMLYLLLRAGNPTTVTTPTNWNLFLSVNTPTNGFPCRGFYKVADGSEGSTVAVTVGTTSPQASIAYRIDSYQGAPSVGTTTGGSGTSIDPPSYTAPWGLYKNLWLAFGCTSFASLTGTPTNYSNAISTGFIRSSQFQFQGATQDPSAYTGNTSTPWVAATIVLKGN